MRATAYVINLDRSADRRLYIETQARSVGLPFERVAAVDGAALPANVMGSHRGATGRRLLTAGELGCWLSHRKVWELICQRGEAWGLVLEDDVQISPDLPQILDDLDALPQDADVVKIDTSLGVKVELARDSAPFGSRKLHRLRRNSWGTAGYAISQRACRWLLDNTETPEAPIDLYLFSPRFHLFKVLKTYVMVPAAVVQEQHLARLSGEGATLTSVIPFRDARYRPNLRVHEKVLREIGRIFLQARAIFAYRTAIEWR
jgi:glycosyl transferase family 25